LRVLSGIQPSGRLHIGNYFGAMRQHLQLEAENEAYYFIADYHALTSNPDPQDIGHHTLDVAMDYLALGLNPDKTVFWRQSDVPEILELSWLLSCVTPMGLLQRCVSFKDKVAQGLNANHGLFSYPVLQAADILSVKANLVPVGADQKQHIEVTRDIATRFNMTYGELFPLPEPGIIESVAVVPGIDGRKMSKSYNNTIEIFAQEKQTKKQIMRIVTDSSPVEAPKDPDASNIYALLKLVAEPDELAHWRTRFLEGGMGYGEAKKHLAIRLIEYFQPYRRKREELAENPDYVRSVLAKGAERAGSIIHETLDEARRAVGLNAL